MWARIWKRHSGEKWGRCLASMRSILAQEPLLVLCLGEQELCLPEARQQVSARIDVCGDAIQGEEAGAGEELGGVEQGGARLLGQGLAPCERADQAVFERGFAVAHPASVAALRE